MEDKRLTISGKNTAYFGFNSDDDSGINLQGETLNIVTAFK